MTTEKDMIEGEVDRTLECFEKIESIEPSTFFYTRLEARIESHTTTGKTFPARIFSLSALQPALVACLIIINVCSAVLLFRGIATEPESREESLTALARKYNLIQASTETANILG